MAWNAPPTRCTLTVDLTRYHHHLVPGVQGTLVPKVKTTSWGESDRFGAVKFDCCGHTIDIVIANLTLEDGASNTPSPKLYVPPEQRQEVLDLLADLD